jgi:hypothetical protein
MVPSSMLIVSIDVECLTCDGFSLGETVHLGSFEFITGYFNDLSLSPRRSGLDAAFMGSTRSGSPSSRWAKVEDSIEEFHTTSRAEGGSGLPSPRRHGTGAPPTPAPTTSWLENAPATQAMMMVSLRAVVAQLDTSLPFERQRAHQEGQ